MELIIQVGHEESILDNMIFNCGHRWIMNAEDIRRMTRPPSALPPRPASALPPRPDPDWRGIVFCRAFRAGEFTKAWAWICTTAMFF